MNKLAIPAILVATVMVAGIFAFMPVQQASTVHTSGTITTASDADIDTILAAVDTEVAAILVDTSTTIPASTSGIIVTTVIGDGADELYDGTITYNFDAGIDSARIIALFFCDFDQSGSVSDSGDDIAITPINVFGGDLTDGDGTLVAGTTIEQDTMADNDCVEIIEDGIFVPLVVMEQITLSSL